MSVEYWVERLRRRGGEVQRDPHALFGQAVSDEAAELWRAAQPADPRHPTPLEAAGLSTAHQWLGWLHSLRYAALPEEPGRIEMAKALVHLGHPVQGPAFVPESLSHLFGPAARPDHQALQAGNLLADAMRTDDPVLLDASIQLHEAAMPVDTPNHGVVLSNAAAAYWKRFELTGRMADLDRCIEIGHHASVAYPEDPFLPTILANLGTAYWGRYGRTGDGGDLDQAIGILRHATAVSPEENPHLTIALSNLSAAYLGQYERTEEVSALDLAIEIGSQAVAASAEPLPAALSNIGQAFWSRHERTGRPADLDRAIEYGNRAMAAGPDAGLRPTTLSNLGVSLQTRFERTGNTADLDRAVDIHQEAIADTPDGHPDRALRLSNLATALQGRFQRTGVRADLERAILAAEGALACFPLDHPVRPRCLNILGSSLNERFERTGNTADLNLSIEYKEQAVAGSRRPSDEANNLSGLGLAYQARYERIGDATDLDLAVETGQRAVTRTPYDHPDLAARLNNLGKAFQRRFERTGDLADLSRAIECGERAVTGISIDQSVRRICLSNLGLAYQARYQRIGDTADLDRAIETGHHAVVETPEDHPDLPLRLNNLGVAFQARFARTGSIGDLNRSLAHKEKALAATPGDHPLRANLTANLGTAYQTRFTRAGNPDDLDRAVEAGQLALALTPDDHPDRVNRVSLVARAFLSRFRHAGYRADLDEAVRLTELAVAAVGDNLPTRAALATRLGVALHFRFLETEDTADLEQALTCADAALAATPPDHPLLAQRLFNVAVCWETRLDRGETPDPVRIDELADRLTAAPALHSGTHVRAGRVIGKLAHSVGKHETARRLLDAAVALLPSVPARETLHADQEHLLDGHLGLVGEAVAVHCELDDPVGAVRVGEQGRGILLAAQLDSRADLSGLEAEHPELARRFQRVRDDLNASALSEDDVLDQRTRWWTEHDALLADIRREPGWGGFLLPPDWTDLRPAAAGGTVVLLNSGSRRGDAIVIPAGSEPVLVPLPGLRLSDVDYYVKELAAATGDTSSFTGELRRRRVLTELLGWLWDAAVGPVLDQVRADRVWWMPTGLLGLLPLHAAGHPGQPGALDRVISSYTPTLRSLVRSREQQPAASRSQLTVALARTPGLPDLPATAAEATALHTGNPGSRLLTNDRATVARVLEALPQASWTHFACHAGTDPDAPSRGGLHLHDGALPIAEVNRLDLPGAELAYLSACSTGHVGRRQANEAVHLASAFQLAGFRHIIASLWPLNDGVAATAAGRFYQLMPPTPDADHAATALHHVTRELRTDHPDRPHVWASLIHSGP